MNAEETERALLELNLDGRLADEDLARARAALRAELPLDERVAELLLWAEVARLDREWDSEREQYKVRFRQARFIPTKASSVVMGLIMVAAGVIWTVGVASIKADFGPGFRWWPLYGAIFIVAWLAFCALAYGQAARYEQAYEAHQRRREQLISDFIAGPHPQGPGVLEGSSPSSD
jgi:hypothetical protein